MTTNELTFQGDHADSYVVVRDGHIVGKVTKRRYSTQRITFWEFVSTTGAKTRGRTRADAVRNA